MAELTPKSAVMCSPTAAPLNAGGISAVEITALRRHTTLRLKAWQPAQANGAAPVVLAGQALPAPVGAIASGPPRVLCIGPGDWLVVSPEESAAGLRERLTPDLTSHDLALVELTDGLATLEVRGPAARELLSKGCALDLHPHHFPPDQCARTRFAQIPVVIECLEAPMRFELSVARSQSHYLHAWLTDAALEFQGSQT